MYLDFRKEHYIAGEISQTNLTPLHIDIANILKQHSRQNESVINQSIIQNIDAEIKRATDANDSSFRIGDENDEESGLPEEEENSAKPETQEKKSTSLSNLKIAGIALGGASCMYILYCAKKWYWNMTPENKTSYNNKFVNFVFGKMNKKITP